jgi:nicotinate phosphoribosyltransferase
MIINSLLDTDFYKYGMAQFVFHYQPGRSKIAEYSMKCRSGENLLLIQKQLTNEIEHWLSLKLSHDELKYLSEMEINGSKVFKDDFIEFLKTLDLKNNIHYNIVIENGHLNIRVHGEWVYSIFAEVPFLAIVQELYWKDRLSEEEYKNAENEFYKRLIEKTEYLKTTKIRFSEFGSRRRFSFKMQRLATNCFYKNAPKNLIGTSNLLLAKEFGINVTGTCAHETFMGLQSLSSSFELSQKELLEQWLVEYPDKLKIALSDIWGTDMFLLDMNKELTEKYDGFRQDSGIPREVAHKYQKHFNSFNIPTKSKTVLFSDDLNFVKANDLEKEFGDIFNVLFGIGTFCSNDTGYKPVSIVMKMVRMNGIAVIKISDSEGKIMCEDQEAIKKTQAYIKIRLNKI